MAHAVETGAGSRRPRTHRREPRGRAARRAHRPSSPLIHRSRSRARWWCGRSRCALRRHRDEVTIEADDVDKALEARVRALRVPPVAPAPTRRHRLAALDIQQPRQVRALVRRRSRCRPEARSTTTAMAAVVRYRKLSPSLSTEIATMTFRSRANVERVACRVAAERSSHRRHPSGTGTRPRGTTSWRSTATHRSTSPADRAGSPSGRRIRSGC